MVKVRFTRSYLVAKTGASYSAGQGAAFPEEEALALIARGVAVVQAKTVDAPPQHKMVSTPAHKKDVRALKR